MLISIDDPADPQLADYRDLTDAQLRAAEFAGKHSFFIAEGEGVVRHLIASRFATRSVFLTPQHAMKLAEALKELPITTPVYVAPPTIMEAITGFAFHRGVLASGQRMADPLLAELLRTSRVLVVAEHLSNIENIGAIFRNVACLAGTNAAVLLTPDCCHPLYRKSLRVSMGHALRIPFATLTDWPRSFATLDAAGFTTIALTPRRDATDIRAAAQQWATRPAFKPALILGAEGPGLSDAALAVADLRVKINMADGADSLNVATALAVALSHLRLE